MPPSSPIAYRPEIDGLRAIAIASVVLFHAGSSWFPGGYVGVDVFFVISGYLITSIIVKEQAEGRFSYAGFYARRARRILPALFFMLTVVTAVSFAILFPVALVEYGKMLIYTLIFAANFRLAAAAGYFDAWNQDNPLIHMWSLAVEEQFYLLYPILLIFTYNRLGIRNLGIAIGALALVSFTASQILVHAWPRSAFYHLPARSWELSLGAILALGAIPEMRSQRWASLLSLSGLMLLAAPVFLYTKDTLFPGIAALPPVAGCALIIYAETRFQSPIGSMLRLKPFVQLGSISYSIYLWHWPVFAIFQCVYFREPTLYETFICIIAIFIISIFSWKFVEQPFRGKSPLFKFAILRGRVVGAKAAMAAAIALAVALIGLGSTFQESSGAVWRFSAETRTLLPDPHADLWKRPCSSVATTESGLSICNIGDLKQNQPAAFVLWGDSHVQNYIHALAKIYGTGTVFIYHGCTPLFGVTRVDGGRNPASKRCSEAKAEVSSWIEANKPKLVLIASRWSLSEESPYGLEKRPTGFFIAGETDPLDIETTRSVFASAIPATVKKITATGARVVLMGQVPETKQNTRSCAAAFSHLGFGNERCAAIPRAEVERRLGRVNKILAAAAKANPQVTVFLPQDSMCDNRLCYAIRAGEVLYEDGDHLSPEGSYFLEAALRAALLPQNNFDAPHVARKVEAIR